MFKFKKATSSQAQRKRRKSTSSSSGADDEDDGIGDIANELKTSKCVPNTMIQGTTRSKMARTMASTSSRARQASSSSESDDNGPSRGAHSYTAKRDSSRAGPSDGGATKELEIDTEKGQDNQTLIKKAHVMQQELKTKGLKEDNIYRGEKNRRQYIEKKDSIFGNVGGAYNHMGPVRAPANVRVTVRWDYAPDLCKDWKETGFCGFGDSCKFMHDRTDYKFGWQIEKDLADGNAEEEDMSKCGHYFCEKCALEHYKKSKRCFVCGENTMGLFNPAKDLERKLAGQTKEMKKKGLKKSSDEESEESD